MNKKPQATMKPGQVAPRSGQYAVMGPKGGNIGREVTAVAGKPLPPTQKPGQVYVLVDPTQHKK